MPSDTIAMDAFNSLQSLSSVAIWPVLMMNWRSILAYFPALESFVNGLNVDVLIQLVLGTRLGLSGLGLISTLALLHISYSAYRTIQDLALATCYTKCSVSEGSAMYDQITEWITRNPRFRSVNTGEFITKYDVEIEIPDADDTIDIARMTNEIVSSPLDQSMNLLGPSGHQIADYQPLRCLISSQK